MSVDSAAPYWVHPSSSESANKPRNVKFFQCGHKRSAQSVSYAFHNRQNLFVQWNRCKKENLHWLPQRVYEQNALAAICCFLRFSHHNFYLCLSFFCGFVCSWWRGLWWSPTFWFRFHLSRFSLSLHSLVQSLVAFSECKMRVMNNNNKCIGFDADVSSFHVFHSTLATALAAQR